MRKLIALAAVAPIALLAACGDSAQDDAGPEPMDTMGLQTPQPETMPPVPENALATVDFAGSYTMTGLDGSVSRIVLDAEDDTYEFTGGDGSTTSGSFARMDDGSRIMIEDFDGRDGYFAIADGAIYRLGSEDTSVEDISATGMYQREDSAA